MSETADTLIKFFTESEFWATNRDFITREDVIHHEVHFETSIDPISLEYLFLEYLGVLERRVESIGHAIVGDTAYIKLYTIERPILNAVWKYNENVVISEQDPWYVSWSDADVASYLERVRPRRATAADAAKAEEFFESEAWLDVASKLHDSETEHFHVFVRTELHPDDLDHYFRRRSKTWGSACGFRRST